MSFKHSSPLLGYNNNVRHRGKVFHVQTEDSGVKYGHIMTHLFMDGGRILKSMKTSYAEYIGGERLGDILREMMKEQHKSMIIALRDGKFDAMADGSAPEFLPAKKAEIAPESTATGAADIAPPAAARFFAPAGQAPSPKGPPPLPTSERRPAHVSSIPAERRYAPTRPASIFGQARPGQGKTLFGEDPVSDKSLDEVILSYLAEDLDAPKK